ncbi:hypothetical protein BpHYR1_053133 [Brachionus plicatilis]|uniref:Uncharacterized protein n=1 Tax=Brachionus plicatilis TaxID=10195 RepID=A0A3M7Q961_BRAPC|nr:hypothetical protein BpHYR1_053133 [Brachionus plicatilis]
MVRNWKILYFGIIVSIYAVSQLLEKLEQYQISNSVRKAKYLETLEDKVGYLEKFLDSKENDFKKVLCITMS